MGTRKEVVQLESRLDVDDYQKLKSLFIVSPIVKWLIKSDEKKY